MAIDQWDTLPVVFLRLLPPTVAHRRRRSEREDDRSFAGVEEERARNGLVHDDAHDDAARVVTVDKRSRGTRVVRNTRKRDDSSCRSHNSGDAILPMFFFSSSLPSSVLSPVKRYLAQCAFHATNRQGTTSPITIQGRPPMWRADKKSEQGEGCWKTVDVMRNPATH